MGIFECIAIQVKTSTFCNDLDGYYPGKDSTGVPFPSDQSLFLREMNLNPIREAQHTFALWSTFDQSSTQPEFYGRITEEYPTMDAAYKFDSPEYTHDGVKDLTGEMQYNLVNYHYFFPDDDKTNEKKSETKAFLE